MRYIGIALLYFLFIGEGFARAGGGGGGGGSSGGGDGGGVFIVLLVYGVYYIRRKKLLKKAQKDLEYAVSQDSSWNIDGLKEVTKEIFMKYQEAWMQKDISGLRHLMTKYYHEKAIKIMNKQLSGKKNILDNIKIYDINIISVRDKLGRDGDMFAMEIKASMTDYTIDEKTGKFISSTLGKKKNESQKDYELRAKKQKQYFIEYWVFMRYNNTWRLNDIKQRLSIVKDIIGLSQAELLLILKKEKTSEDVDDSVFYSVNEYQDK